MKHIIHWILHPNTLEGFCGRLLVFFLVTQSFMIQKASRPVVSAEERTISTAVSIAAKKYDTALPARNLLISSSGRVMDTEQIMIKVKLYCESTASFEELNEGNFRDVALTRTPAEQRIYRIGQEAIYEAAKSEYCPAKM